MQIKSATCTIYPKKNGTYSLILIFNLAENAIPYSRFSQEKKSNLLKSLNANNGEWEQPTFVIFQQKAFSVRVHSFTTFIA